MSFCRLTRDTWQQHIWWLYRKWLFTLYRRYGSASKALLAVQDFSEWFLCFPFSQQYNKHKETLYNINTQHTIAASNKQRQQQQQQPDCLNRWRRVKSAVIYARSRPQRRLHMKLKNNNKKAIGEISNVIFSLSHTTEILIMIDSTRHRIWCL